MLDLAYTENKRAIRGQWDKAIIAKFYHELGHHLSYFGLPGPDIRDFIDWREYLGWKTAVELITNGPNRTEQLRRANKLKTNMNLQRLAGTWELRKGSLEDIVVNGYDADGNLPKLLSIQQTGIPKMRYDLHNWDFQSGLGYIGGSLDVARKRLDAIKRCIELQRDCPFLFLITLNVRHGLGDEFTKYLVGHSRTLVDEYSTETLNWYAVRSSTDNTDRYRLKAAFPLIVRGYAESNSFDCYCYPPLSYAGHNAHLMHFAFVLKPALSVLPTHSRQTREEVISFPFLEAKDGNIIAASLQHPNLNLHEAIILISKVLDLKDNQ